MSSLTLEQQQAINATGNVLVVAGAGTGKTTTLVTRCEKFLLNKENPVLLNSILMVTFTEAAAAEMRLRIRRLLENEILKGENKELASEQLALLPTAHICTLHSFCLHLIRLYFNHLGIDPQVNVLDEGQAKVLANEVLDEIFKSHYSGECEFDARVRELVKARARGWDLPIREMVFTLHSFAQSLPFGNDWLKNELEIFSKNTPERWLSQLNEEFHHWVRQWLSVIENYLEFPNIKRCHDALLGVADYEDFRTASRSLSEVMAAYNDVWERGTKVKIRDDVFKEFFREAEFLYSLSPKKDGQDPILEDWEMTRGQIKTLIELTVEFGDKFAKAKREISSVDFSDIEQMALGLLLNKDKTPTAIAEELKSRFKLIFVDEYQDINPAQHSIICAISKDGDEANKYLVGDIKQSIYRFRRADPHIFQRLRWEWNEQKHNSAVFHLTQNFRSNKSIIDFVNLVFGALIRAELGGVVYDEEARLKPYENPSNTSADKPNNNTRVEFRIMVQSEADEELSDEYSEGGGDEESELTIVQKEASLIAKRFIELRNSKFEVLDRVTKQFRPVEWRDMVVLLRSVAGKAEIYAREFLNLGVPAIKPSGNIFEAIEAQDLLNIVRLLDNPMQDFPLIAVLRSPLVGFSDAELAVIRIVEPHGRLWSALKRLADSHFKIEQLIRDKINKEEETTKSIEIAKTASDKARYFVEKYEQWRQLARLDSLSHCLETILEETQYVAWCQTQSRGTLKFANVQLLLDIAKQFDPLQRQGLKRFLDYVDARIEAGIETEPASVEGENAVRIMSIHQSKGLEFPVVCVADLGKKFNFKDLTQDIILDEKYGICPKVHPPGTPRTYPSPSYWIVKKKHLLETIGEEMRLLYVAMTRAADYLIVTGNIKEKRLDTINNWFVSKQTRNSNPHNSYAQKNFSTRAPGTAHLLKCKSMLEWLCCWMSCSYQGYKWFDNESEKTDWFDWYIHKYSYQGVELEEEKQTKMEQVDAITDDTLRELNDRLLWKYPWISSTREPAKVSVSEVRKRIIEQSEDESRNIFHFKWKDKIKSSESVDISATERGEIYHRFLQYVDLDRCNDKNALEAELNRLINSKLINEQEAGIVDLELIMNFWNSEPGKLFLENRRYIKRELPFTVRMNSDEIKVFNIAIHKDLHIEDFLLVQGVIDLCMISQDQIWILDFKTDRLNNDPALIAQRCNEYAPQLELYAFALGKIYNRPVTHKWIHFLMLNKHFEI